MTKEKIGGYLSTRELDGPELLRVIARAHKEFRAASSPFPQRLEFRAPVRPAWPLLSELSGITFHAPLEAHSSRKILSLPAEGLVGVLRQAEEALPENATFEIHCDLVERQKGTHGSAWIALGQDGRRLGFKPGGPVGVEMDSEQLAEHRKALFQEAIEAGRLPLRVRKLPRKKALTFEHTAGGSWSCSVSLEEFGPEHVAVAMPAATFDDLAGRLEAMLAGCAPSATRTWWWEFSCPEARPAQCAAVYEVPRAREWPITSFSLQTTLEVADVEAVDRLRRLVSDRRIHIECLVVTFEMPAVRGQPSRSARLYSRVGVDGHQLILQLHPDDADRLSMVAARLKVEF
jgi:hypothetical protein